MMSGARNIDIERVYIHGQFPRPLPKGYGFQIVPEDISVVRLENTEFKICSFTHNILKWIASIIQLIIASVSLISYQRKPN